CERLAERLACAQADSHGQGYSVVITREDSQIIQVAPNQWLYMGTPQSAAQQWTDFVNLDGFAETNEEEWNQLSIRNGIPTLGPETTEVFVPQMINLDALGGISFEKGCYTGQEIVARMHYLGKLKRRMVLAATRSTQLPAPGEPVYASENEQSIGQIVNAAFVNEPEILLLAVIQTEWIESESLHLFNPDASTLKILELPYVILQPAA
ncbi:MAG: YgfZ/GcvT domain-containing protein, partial [Methylococcales bacterium]